MTEIDTTRLIDKYITADDARGSKIIEETTRSDAAQTDWNRLNSFFVVDQNGTKHGYERNIEDNSISCIVNGCPPSDKLNAGGTVFGEKCVDLISKHFNPYRKEWLHLYLHQGGVTNYSSMPLMNMALASGIQFGTSPGNQESCSSASTTITINKDNSISIENTYTMYEQGDKVNPMKILITNKTIVDFDPLSKSLNNAILLADPKGVPYSFKPVATTIRTDAENEKILKDILRTGESAMNEAFNIRPNSFYSYFLSILNAIANFFSKAPNPEEVATRECAIQVMKVPSRREKNSIKRPPPLQQIEMPSPPINHPASLSVNSNGQVYKEEEKPSFPPAHHLDNKHKQEP